MNSWSSFGGVSRISDLLRRSRYGAQNSPTAVASPQHSAVSSPIVPMGPAASCAPAFASRGPVAAPPSISAPVVVLKPLAAPAPATKNTSQPLQQHRVFGFTSSRPSTRPSASGPRSCATVKSYADESEDDDVQDISISGHRNFGRRRASIRKPAPRNLAEIFPLRITCGKCERTYATTKTLERHDKSVHGVDSTEMVCDRCRTVFVLKCRFEAHKRLNRCRKRAGPTRQSRSVNISSTVQTAVVRPQSRPVAKHSWDSHHSTYQRAEASTSQNDQMDTDDDVNIVEVQPKSPPAMRTKEEPKDDMDFQHVAAGYVSKTVRSPQYTSPGLLDLRLPANRSSNGVLLPPHASSSRVHTGGQLTKCPWAPPTGMFVKLFDCYWCGEDVTPSEINTPPLHADLMDHYKVWPTCFWSCVRGSDLDGKPKLEIDDIVKAGFILEYQRCTVCKKAFKSDPDVLSRHAAVHDLEGVPRWQNTYRPLNI